MVFKPKAAQIKLTLKKDRITLLGDVVFRLDFIDI